MNEHGEDLDQPVHLSNLNSLRKARVPKDPRIFMRTAKTNCSDCADRQSCRTEMLCLGLCIFFFAKVTLKIKEVGYGYYDHNMKHCKI